MIKLLKQGFIVVLAILLTSCNYYYEEGIGSIKEPEKLKYELDGEWILKDVKDIKGQIIDKDDYADTAIFHNNFIQLEDIYSENIQYSIKNVDATDYLVYKYKISPEMLGIKTNMLSIFSLSMETNYVTELIKINDDEFAYFKDGKFLIYSRSNEEMMASKSLESMPMAISNSDVYNLEERGNIGFILATKKLEKNGHYKYKTKYLQITNDEEVVEYNSPDILLPRKNGFYKIDIEAVEHKDNLRIKFLDKEVEDRYIETDAIKNILYIGNDFMSVENIDDKDKKVLRLYPIDYLEENRISRLSDILDENTYEKMKKDIKHNQPDRIVNNYDEANFGIKRNQGHWTLFGRVNYLNKNINTYEDFRIRAVTPKSIVNYDELPILWNVIESEIPGIKDAFISPKNDYLIARMDSEIRVYPIVDGDIELEIIYSTKIDKQEELIMGEWATSIYTERWSNYFKGDQSEENKSK